MSSKPPPLQLLVLLLFIFSANSKSDDEGDAWANGDSLTPTMAIILILSFCITACIYIYFAIIRNNSNNEDASSPGLPQTIIDTFPTFPFSIVKHHNIGKAALECAVCLSDFVNEDETLRLLPNCDHVFHSQCIDKWLVAHATCPVCRDNLANNLPTDDVRVTIPGRLLPRSNSTGHSPTQLGEDHERFRLIISAEMRREIIDRMTLTRATSMVTLPRQSSSPQSYRGSGGGGGGGSRSYFGRLLASMKSTAAAAARVVAEGDSTAECKLDSRPLLV